MHDTSDINTFHLNPENVSAEIQEEIYEEMLKIARGKRAALGKCNTHQTSDFAAEAYLALSGRTEPWPSRRYFYAAVAQKVAEVIVDHFRRKSAARRGSGIPDLPLTKSLEILVPSETEEVLRRKLDLVGLLPRLRERDAALAEIVAMKVLLNMPSVEIAEVLGESEKAVSRQWQLAKIWLHSAVNHGSETPRESEDS
jgi:RNA polymerase sigma factor (TIGR02999 family)